MVYVIGLGFRTEVGSSDDSSDGSVEIQVEGYSGLANKCDSGARVVMATGPLTRGTDSVVGEVIGEAVGYYPLRLGVRCSGDTGVKIW